MTIIDLESQIKEIQDDPGPFKVLIYGHPGSGKTKLCAEFPDVLIVDADRKGTRTLLNHEHLRSTPILRIRSYQDVLNVIFACREGKLSKYKTIVIDSISELQRRHMDEHLKQLSERDRNRSPYLPFQNDYKENSEILRRIVTGLADLDDRNIILTAHEQEMQDNSGTIYIRPLATPKFEGSLYGIMDGVFRITADYDNEGVTKRELQVHPTRRIRAKCRLGFYLPKIVNPEAGHILKAAEHPLENPIVGDLPNQLTSIGVASDGLE